MAIINDNIDFNDFNLKFTKFATLHFEDVHSISVDKDGVNRLVEAKSIIRYDNVDEISNLKVKIIRDERVRYLKADMAHFYKTKSKVGDKVVEREIFFEGNIVYSIDKNFVLKSDKMNYDFKKDKLFCHSFFTLEQDENVIRGDSFEYEIGKKINRAQNIKSEIYLEE